MRDPARMSVPLNRRMALAALLAGLSQVAASSEGAVSNEISVKSFGAKGDGQADDASAIRAAIDAVPVGGSLDFPPGTYRIGSEIRIEKRTGLTFKSRGAVITGLNLRRFFDLQGCSDIRIEGLGFDSRGQAVPAYNDRSLSEDQVAVRFAHGQNLAVVGCSFLNLRTAFVKFTEAAGLQVQCCNFHSPLQPQGRYLVFVEILTAGGAIEISCNRFLGAATSRNDRSPCAVAASGIVGSLNIHDNLAQDCGHNNAEGHRLAVFDVYADAVNVTVAKNIAIACREQFMRLSATVGANIRDNTVWIAEEADKTYSTMTIESGAFPFVRQPVTRQVTVSGNRFIDVAGRQAFAIGVLGYDWGAPNGQILIEENFIQGQRTAVVVSGPFDGVKIVGNTVTDVDAFVSQSLVGDVPLTSKLGNEASARYLDLAIDDNRVQIRNGAGAVAVSLSTYANPPFTGTVGEFSVRRNSLDGIGARARWAVSAIFGTARRLGNLVAEKNQIRGYPTPFYLRSMKSARLVGNESDATGATFTSDGTVAVLDVQSNLAAQQILPANIPRRTFSVSTMASPGCDCATQ
jgi:pectate lyase-like protein